MKPANVLVSATGQLKLCDFGLSRRCRGLFFFLFFFYEYSFEQQQQQQSNAAAEEGSSLPSSSSSSSSSSNSNGSAGSSASVGARGVVRVQIPRRRTTGGAPATRHEW